MIATDVIPAVKTWVWENQVAPNVSDVLVVGFGFANFVVIDTHRLPRLLEALDSATRYEEVLAAFRKPVKLRPTTLWLQDLQAVEHGTLLTEEVVRLLYRAGSKVKMLKLRLPPRSSLFNELRALLSPHSHIQQKEMSLGLAVRGPMLAVVFGALWFSGVAYGATATDLTWLEKYSWVDAVMGTVLRGVGPWGWSIIGALWVAVSALLLRSRIKKRPSVEFWEVEKLPDSASPLESAWTEMQ